MDVRAILHTARTDPRRALVELWPVFGDHRALQACLAHHPRRGPHVTVLIDWLNHDARPLPVNVGSHSAASAAAAIDEILWDEVAGRGTSPARAAGHWVIPRAPGWSSPLVRQPNHAHHWVRHHWVCPERVHGIDVEIARSSAILDEALSADDLGVLTAAFEDGVLPVRRDDEAPAWASDDLTDPALRADAVRAALAAAEIAQAKIVVFPELTVSPSVLPEVSAFLADTQGPIALVVPGSYHRVVDGVRRNEAVLLDRYGEVVLVHHKLQPMRNLPDGEEILEDIAHADGVTLLPTSRGLLAIAICLDFCEVDGPMSALWNTIGPGLVLVPSMSNDRTMRAHEARAKQLLASHGTTTVVANQPHGKAPFGLAIGQGEHWVARVPHQLTFFRKVNNR